MNKQEAMRLFHEQGYTVEYQETITKDITGNFDVENGRHNTDISQSEVVTYYYICEPESAEKYYDLEFTDVEDVVAFIHYVMEHSGCMDDIGQDETLARKWREKAGESSSTVCSK